MVSYDLLVGLGMLIMSVALRFAFKLGRQRGIAEARFDKHGNEIQ